MYFRERYENRINEIDDVSYILPNKGDRTWFSIRTSITCLCVFLIYTLIQFCDCLWIFDRYLVKRKSMYVIVIKWLTYASKNFTIIVNVLDGKTEDIRVYTREKMVCWPIAEKLKEYIRGYRMMKQATDGTKREKSKFKKKYWILIHIFTDERFFP